jgi:hypothetical protein
MAEFTGGCLCGAVRYTARAEPAFVSVCHCRDCQKLTGSAFGALAGFPQSAVEIHGMLKTFTKIADSGRPIVRRFCPECGSSISEEPAARPDMVILNVGTFDDPTALRPAVQIYCDRALPWVQLAGNMQSHPRGRPVQSGG